MYQSLAGSSMFDLFVTPSAARATTCRCTPMVCMTLDEIEYVYKIACVVDRLAGPWLEGYINIHIYIDIPL